ncbi:MAG: hypothetical protein JST40_07045 [Armatimonadetes bacterium]|nr:hypothetical protein [Armatimonadota bacterium]
MSRWNSEGLRLDQLSWALSRPDIVREYRKLDKCMLCMRPGVNAAGLCDICLAIISPEMRDLAEKWLRGIGP